MGLVIDGAGSAVNAHRGAALACEAGCTIIKNWAEEAQDLSALTPNVVTGWVEGIRSRIYATAEWDQCRPRDFACTLLGAVVGEGIAAFFQIGDGAIVVEDGGSLTTVFWPDAGEYANTTYFITDEDAIDHLHVKIMTTVPRDVALLSDGLQRLALVYESKSVFKPFFEPMFNRLRLATGPEACDDLADQLADFLDSPKINERTDDDKTLVLATRKCSGDLPDHGQNC